MIYVLILLLLVFLSIECEKWSGKKVNIYYWLVFCVFVFIAAFRRDIGNDSISYARNYLYVPDLANLNMEYFNNSRYQPGYILFISLCKSISSEFYVLQILHALILNGLLFSFVKKYARNVFVALLCYAIINYLDYNTEIIRESLAIAISLHAFRYFEIKKWIHASILFLLAFSFHISAICVLLYPILFLLNGNLKSVIITSIASLLIPFSFNYLPNIDAILLFFGGDVTDMTYAYSIHELNSSYNINYYILRYGSFVLFPLMFVVIYYHVNDKPFRYSGFIYAICMLQMISLFSIAFGRFSNYFLPFTWILISETITSIRTNGYKKILILFVTFFMLYSYQIKLIYLDEWKESDFKYIYQRYIPYKTIFD